MGQKSKKGLNPRPASPSLREFFPAQSLFPDKVGFGGIFAVSQKNNQVKTTGCVRIPPESEQLIPVVDDLFSGCDFGRRPTVKLGLAFSAPTPCARCGQLFASIVRVGRPERFCSEECRHVEAYQQRQAWRVGASAVSEDRPTQCQQCGAALAVKSTSAGRFRRFCSRRCLKKSREPPKGPDLLDTVRKSKPQEAAGHETEADKRRD